MTQPAGEVPDLIITPVGVELTDEDTELLRLAIREAWRSWKFGVELQFIRREAIRQLAEAWEAEAAARLTDMRTYPLEGTGILTRCAGKLREVLGDRVPCTCPDDCELEH